LKLSNYIKKNYKAILKESIAMLIIVLFSNFIALADPNSPAPFYGVDLNKILLVALIISLPAGISLHHFNLWLFRNQH
jgi:hypothetical protein